MRGLFVVIFLFFTFVMNGQMRRDERKLSFMLDKNVDSLCINCKYQDCEALLYNAVLFRNLETLVMVNFNSKAPLRYITDFRKLRKLVLINPSPFNLSKEVFKANRPFKLRELSIICDTVRQFYDPGLRYYHHKNFFKRMRRLRYLELRRADIGLANKIKMLNKVKSLKFLELIGIGVTLQEIYKIKDRNFNVLEIDEHVNDLNYVGRKFNYLTPRVISKRTGQLIESLRRSEIITTLRYKSLVLHPVEQNNNKSFLIPNQNPGYFGKPKVEFNRRFNYNDQYIDWSVYYGAGDRINNWVYESFKERSRFKYMGSLKTGEKDQRFYSLAYKTYDDYCKLFDFYKWDTTSFRNRLTSFNYTNGELLPIQWNKRRKSSYVKRSKIKKIIKENYSNYKIERLKEKNLFELKPIIKLNYDNKDALDYKRSNKYSELRYFNSYAFSFTDYSANVRRMLRSDILDAWFEYGEGNNTYVLKVKTINKIYSNEITWWFKNGDVLKKDFRPVFLKYEAALLKKHTRAHSKSIRNKDRLMRKYRFHPSFNGLVSFSEYLANRKISRLVPYERKDLRHIHLLSAREQKMNSKYWLSQKENFLKNEKELIKNATPQQVTFSEVLKITGYKNLSIFKWKENYDSIRLVESGINTNAKLLNLQDGIMFILDSEKEIYTTFNLDLGLTSFVNNSNNGFTFYLPTGNMEHQTLVIQVGKELFIAKKIKFTSSEPLWFEKIPSDLINYKIIFNMFN